MLKTPSQRSTHLSHLSKSLLSQVMRCVWFRMAASKPYLALYGYESKAWRPDGTLQ
jgi:hypothetical protein